MVNERRLKLVLVSLRKQWYSGERIDLVLKVSTTGEGFSLPGDFWKGLVLRATDIMGDRLKADFDRGQSEALWRREVASSGNKSLRTLSVLDVRFAMLDTSQPVSKPGDYYVVAQYGAGESNEITVYVSPRTLRVSLESDKSSWREGEPIPLQVYLTNITEREIHLLNKWDPTEQYFEVKVYDESGVEVLSRATMHAKISWKYSPELVCKLSPGERAPVKELVFAGIQTANGSTQPLKPGKYSLSVIYENRFSFKEPSLEVGKWISEPITVSIG
jgi:hypothetical protein